MAKPNTRNPKPTRRHAEAGKADGAVINRLLARLKAGQDLRRLKVRRIKSALRQQVYFNNLKLDVAADRLARDLTSEE